MKRQTLITIAVVFTVITMVGTAFAWNGCGRKANAKGDYNGRGCAQQGAQLTDVQKGELKNLQQKFIDDTADIRASMLTKHEQIRIFMKTSAPDKAKLQTLFNEIGDLKKEIMNKKLDMALAVKEIAPDLNIPMGLHGIGKFGKMGMGMSMGMSMGMDKGKGKGCGGWASGSGSGKEGARGCPEYKGKGHPKCKGYKGQGRVKEQRRVNCPALATESEEVSTTE